MELQRAALRRELAKAEAKFKAVEAEHTALCHLPHLCGSAEQIFGAE